MDTKHTLNQKNLSLQPVSSQSSHPLPSAQKIQCVLSQPFQVPPTQSVVEKVPLVLNQKLLVQKPQTSQPSQFRNVHETDGKYRDHGIKTRFSPPEKKVLFDWLLESAKDQSGSLRAINLVIKDAQLPPNYDNTNQVFADDVLAELLNLIISMESGNQKIFLGIIKEQLEDMLLLGQCPQGRTGRLLQLYSSLKVPTQK